MDDKADAARYRFLKDRRRLGYWRVQQWDAEDHTYDTVSAEQLDEEIDEAIRGDNDG